MRDVRVINRMDQLAAISDQWSALSGTNLMRSWMFQRCWIEHFASRHSLRVLVMERDQSVIGILPLVEERRVWTGRTLVNVGSGRACLDHLGLIAREEHAQEAARAFADFLLHSREIHWDYLDLDGLRVADTAMKIFVDHFVGDGHASAENRVGPHCWAIALNPGPDGYHVWPKRLRSVMRRGREELSDGTIDIRIADDAHSAMEGLEAIEAIHQARWASRGVKGCFSDPSFSRFVKALVLQNWESGHAVVAVLRSEGAPAAGAICFRDRDTLSVYVASMAPGFEMQKPGWKLNGYLADYALRHRCKYVDFMRGDEEYKSRLGATPTAQQRWMIPCPSWRGRMHRALYRTAREIKNCIAVPTSPVAAAETADA